MQPANGVNRHKSVVLELNCCPFIVLQVPISSYLIEELIILGFKVAMAVTRWLQRRPMMGCGSLIGSWFLIEGETEILNKVEDGNDLTLIDIDSKHNDPRMCSLYAAEFTL
ncbi:hypothetical protein HanRHA438_Chr02g0095411 [Helianthus annuus]|uniref:Uncharacterized protein n=1 Tax=Helianthus annuus TaxID=4232 RepID=A0A9K3JS70_HELAN|nr:hypothetical protein HanXRQr2_Chr02g0084031 [Helianthus annuus]KAJ0606091.1 hypothetical protein HanHA300_Chr02g0070231 [Helianthus annuus]KAJ0778557.1 hypothetical protein HanLR1_Chr02g0072981 [Helianthus annuus]KAJ0787514.1 hypothetical protein HanOQP8_Chr02g0083301 [Helianthus annuus]KAJ0941522.1 hypothetical protein HanRHA438_Chr02g0095411 [Helianthus annuus]